MKRTLAGVLIVALLSLPLQARAQVAALVYDPSNWAANIAQLAQTILIVANQLTDLASMGANVVGGDDLGDIAAIVRDAEALSADFKSLEVQATVLFNLQTAPATRSGLTERLRQIKQLKYNAQVYALRTQSLMLTVARTLEHLADLLSRVSNLLGNLQGHQTVAQVNTTVSKTLLLIEVQQAAYQRAGTIDQLTDGVILASIAKIEEARLEDMPSW
jgi:hypothetical protein